MKKKYLNFLAMAVISTTVVFTSCKDEATEEDLLVRQSELKLKQTMLDDSLKRVGGVVQYSVTVSAANQAAFSNANGRTEGTTGVSGASVTVSQNGKVTTVQTDANGIAVFPDCRIGSASVVVKLADHTTANAIVDLTPEGDYSNSGSVRQAATLIPLFATSGADNLATITGKVTIETDLTNITRELAPNTVSVVAMIDGNNNAFKNTYFNSGSSLERAGKVVSISYENALAKANVDANGMYTLAVPASAAGLPMQLVFSDIATDQKIAINKFEGQTGPVVPSVQMVRTVFSQATLSNNPGFGFNSSNFLTIPSVKPVFASVTAPKAAVLAGSGAAATVKLKATTIDANEGFEILSGGTGYTPYASNIPVTITGGDFDNGITDVTGNDQAKLYAIADQHGKIFMVTGTKNYDYDGAGTDYAAVPGDATYGVNKYRSRATLTIGGTGSGAVVRNNYTSSVAEIGDAKFSYLGSALTAGGTSYSDEPTIRFIGKGSDPNSMVNTTSWTTISNGNVVNFGTPGQAFISAPTVSFDAQTPTVGTQAEFTVLVSNDGRVTDITVSNAGSGYEDGSLAITITSLLGGSGATAVAKVEGGKIISPVVVTNQGSGYPAGNSNINFSSGSSVNFSMGAGLPSSGSQDNAQASIIVKPASTYVRDVHYGTGVRERGVQ